MKRGHNVLVVANDLCIHTFLISGVYDGEWYLRGIAIRCFNMEVDLFMLKIIAIRKNWRKAYLKKMVCKNAFVFEKHPVNVCKKNIVFF